MDDLVKVIFRDELLIYIGQVNDDGAFVWSLGNEIYNRFSVKKSRSHLNVCQVNDQLKYIGVHSNFGRFSNAINSYCLMIRKSFFKRKENSSPHRVESIKALLPETHINSMKCSANRPIRNLIENLC